MKLITRNTDYAIRALCCIAEKKEEIVSVNQLVKNLNMPRPFLRRIMQILNKEEIVRSYKGKGGGFSLAMPPIKINVIRIMEIFRGPVRINECTFKKEICPNVKHCLLKKKLDEIEKEVITKLDKITLDSLLKKEESKK